MSNEKKKAEKVLDQMNRRDFVKAFSAGVAATHFPEPFGGTEVVTESDPNITTGKTENVEIDVENEVHTSKSELNEVVKSLREEAESAFASFVSLDVSLEKCTVQEGSARIGEFKNNLEKIDGFKVILNLRDSYLKMVDALKREPETISNLRKFDPKRNNWG